MHLLLWLSPESKLRNSDDVDSIISAEIPDPETHPRLYEIVTQTMVHGPCGDRKVNANCMKDGKCSKYFPKQYQETTSMNEDGYPQYRRRNNRRIFTKKVDGQDVNFENRDVVPYCAFLTLKIKCHINVEVTIYVRAIKYIHKYLYKGNDRTTMVFQVDEVKQYLDAWYICAQEAFWRLCQHEIHIQVPAVVALPVHLPGHHTVLYDVNMDAHTIAERADASQAMLMAFFQSNAQIGPGTPKYLYVKYPEHFVWQKKEHV